MQTSGRESADMTEKKVLVGDMVLSRGEMKEGIDSKERSDKGKR
jgi:hypothetical protein